MDSNKADSARSGASPATTASAAEPLPGTSLTQSPDRYVT
jgi:hypothetical protein